MPKRPERRTPAAVVEQPQYAVQELLGEPESVEAFDPDTMTVSRANPADAKVPEQIQLHKPLKHVDDARPWTPTQQMVLTPTEKLRYQLLVVKKEAEALKAEVRRRDADKVTEKMAHLTTRKLLLAEQGLTAQLRAQLASKELDDQLTILASQKTDALADAEKKSTFPDEWKAVSEDVKRRLEIPAGYSMSLDMETGAVAVETEG